MVAWLDSQKFAFQALKVTSDPIVHKNELFVIAHADTIHGDHVGRGQLVCGLGSIDCATRTVASASGD